jgi:DNA-binding response OmpR family regulator
MHPAQGTGSRQHRTADDLTDAQRAFVLVGEAAKDRDRIDALLSANVMVILLPSLETTNSLLGLGPKGGRAPPPSHAAARVGNLQVDLTEHRVLFGQREIPITERELAMLAILCQEPRRARSFAELAEPGGRDWLGDTERVHAAVRRLRKKLAEAGVRARIESVRGYGFRIVGSPPLGDA